ncbi:hypothetical protein F4778DRAFT_517354 [Xylariomycetidae sp. FL2044]|nr:hypothetical protein F4778DRAFT_517354 [Xylariomycetidae sp. FL2044]
MRGALSSTAMMLGVIATLAASGVHGQRLRVEQPMEPSIVDGATKANEGSYVPDEAMIAEVIPINRTDVQPAEPQQPAQPAPPVPPTEDEEPITPILALLYASSPGPKECRGNIILRVNLAKPGTDHTTPQCYNVPGVSQCGVFMANKDDGCEARLFNEPNCLTFANLGVFTPEVKPMGGLFRSIEIACGIEGVAPPPLHLPGMDLPADAQQAVG